MSESPDPAKRIGRPTAREPKNFEGTTRPFHSGRRLTRWISAALSRASSSDSDGEGDVVGFQTPRQFKESLMGVSPAKISGVQKTQRGISSEQLCPNGRIGNAGILRLNERPRNQCRL